MYCCDRCKNKYRTIKELIGHVAETHKSMYIKEDGVHLHFISPTYGIEKKTDAREELLERHRYSTRTPTEIESENGCAICCTNINCLILPCKHTVTCKDCCDKLRTCQLCRCKIVDRMII